MTTSSPLDKTTVLERARAQIEDRLVLVSALVDAVAAAQTAHIRAEQTRAAAGAADSDARDCYDAALKAGWTDAELRGAGLSRPAGKKTTRTPVRNAAPPARTRFRPAMPTTAASASNSHNNSSGDMHPSTQKDNTAESGFAHTG